MRYINRLTHYFTSQQCIKRNKTVVRYSVGIDLKELGGSAAKMFEILPRD